MNTSDDKNINIQILEELKQIRQDIDFLKSNIIDSNLVLTQEEMKIVAESEREYEKGETVSLNEAKKKLNL